MIATSLTARIGAAAAAGAMAFTAFAGTGLAAGYNLSVHSSFDSDDVGGMTLESFCDDLSDYKDYFSRSDYKELKNRCDEIEDFEDDECGVDVGGFGFGGWMNPFQGAFGGFQTANVNADADTTVNNEINAGSANDVNVNQSGGLGSATVDADASTTVNNEINAFSENTVNVQQ